MVYLYAAAVYQPIERGRVRATAELSQAKVEMEGLSAALAAARSELARIKAGGKPTPSAAPVLLHPRDGAGVVLDEILRLRDAAGVEVRGLVPSAMVDKGTYNDLAVKVSVRGRTSDVVRYLALLEAHEPVLDVRRLKMETTPASLPRRGLGTRGWGVRREMKPEPVDRGSWLCRFRCLGVHALTHGSGPRSLACSSVCPRLPARARLGRDGASFPSRPEPSARGQGPGR